MENKRENYTYVIARPTFASLSVNSGPKQSLFFRLLRRPYDLLAMTVVLICTIYSPLFATTEVPVTATARVLPEGVYAPVITVNDQTVREGQILEFEVLATDANTEDTVTLTISQGQPSWLSIVTNTPGNPARMLVRAAPSIGDVGTYRDVRFRATDNSSYDLSTEKEIDITVTPSNQAPVITAQNQTVQVGNPLTFTVNCRDPDNSDTVTLTFSGTPGWLTPSSPSGVSGNPIDVTFTGTPLGSDEGRHTITFEAVDNGTPRQRATKELTIIVSRFNRPPVLEPIRDKESPVRVRLEFTISATDPDGDPLTYRATGSVFNNGATFNSSTHRFSWTPTDAQAGSYPVHFEVSDGTLTDSEDITIYVTANDAPVFDPVFDMLTMRIGTTPWLRIRVGETIHFVVTAQDPNNDSITYGVLNLPTGAAFDLLTHAFTWTPQPGQENQDYNITFTASDGTFTTNMPVLITVLPPTAPRLKLVGRKEVRAGQTLSFTLEAVDPDTPLNQLVYSVSNNPANSSLTGANFTFTPVSSQAGITYKDIIFTVTDGTSSDFVNCWITVVANGAPEIETIGTKYVVEGRPLTFVVNATDPDGDPLTYLQPLNAPKGSFFDPITHTFTWTPAEGEKRFYNDIIFSVTDGIYTDTDNVWIYVVGRDAPVVDPVPAKKVRANETLTFSINAYDPNGDELIYRVLNPPQGAVFNNRTFTWTPAISQVGTYKDILFEVSDRVNIVTVRTWIFVIHPDSPLMERVGEKYITAGQTLSFTVNAYDPNGNPLTYSISNRPSGAIFDPSSRTFTWTPTLADAAISPFPNVLFYVTDGTYTDTENCWIFVYAPGAPVLTVPGVPGGLKVRAGTKIEFTVSATDPDTAGSQLTYSISNPPPGATFDPSTRIFTWTPTPEQVGNYSDIKFSVSDGAHTNEKLNWIFVKAPGCPLFVEDVRAEHGRIGAPLEFTVLPADDPDNSPGELTYYGVNLPTGATFSDRVFRWTPQAGQEGTYRDVRLEVQDPKNNIDSDILWIYIGNSPPELDFIETQYGRVGQLLTFTISATDVDGDPLTYLARNLPTGATFDAATRRFSWTPTAAGTYQGVHFEVSDAIATDSKDITIIVSP